MKYTRPCHFGPGISGFAPTYDVKAQTYLRLAWVYGPELALQKLRGYDPETQADVEAWRRIGGVAAQ